MGMGVWLVPIIEYYSEELRGEEQKKPSTLLQNCKLISENSEGFYKYKSQTQEVSTAQADEEVSRVLI